MVSGEKFGVPNWLLVAGAAIFSWIGCYVVLAGWPSPDPQPATSDIKTISMGAVVDDGEGLRATAELQPPGPAESALRVDVSDYGIYERMVVRQDDDKLFIELFHRDGPAARSISARRYICVGDGVVATYVLDVESNGDGTLEVVRCRRAEFPGPTTESGES